MNTFIAVPLLSFALLGIASTAYAGFEVEPNDSSSSANVLPLNEVMTGNFRKGQGSSHDYYRFNLPEARPDVSFHFRNTTDNTRPVELGLYDSAMRSISIPTKSVNPFTTFSVDFKQNLAAGTYYVKIYSSQPSADNAYELSISTKVSVTPSIVGSVGMPDLNENGNKDIAILRILADTSGVVETRDGSTGELLNSIPLEGESLKPISITGFDDMNVGVLVYDSITKTHTQSILNAKTGELVVSFPIE